MKTCRACGETKPLEAFRLERLGVLGRQARCKECRSAGERVMRTTEAYWNRHLAWRAANREAIRAAEKRWREANPEKRRATRKKNSPPDPKKERARRLVRAALRRGELQRPESCERCGTTEHHIQGHHADYNKPLSVEWLCVPCHRTTHVGEATGAQALALSRGIS